MPSGTERVAVVTGAAGTIGRAVVAGLVADGHLVIAVDQSADRLREATSAQGSRAIPFAADITDPAAVAALWSGVNARFGPVGILVNNAGILSNNKVSATSLEEWHRILAVNLDAPFLLSQRAVGDMRSIRWGRIVNICSLSMKTGGLTAGTAYATSKSALGGLTFSLARETARDQITVNGIAPGYVRTPMVMEQLTEAERNEQLRAIPVGRFCEAEEVAHCVSYLAGPHSGFITGEIIDMNGGMHMD